MARSTQAISPTLYLYLSSDGVEIKQAAARMSTKGPNSAGILPCRAFSISTAECQNT